MVIFSELQKTKIIENLKLIEGYLMNEYVFIKSNLNIQLTDSLYLMITPQVLTENNLNDIKYKNIKLVDNYNNSYGFSSKFGITVYNENIFKYSIHLILQWEKIKDAIIEQENKETEIINKIFDFKI